MEQGTPIELFSNEKLVKKYNLAIPFEVQIRNKLEQEGKDVGDKDILDEAVRLLCR